jgi:hypothetical protein
MTFTIKQIHSTVRAPCDEYLYRIYEDELLVATYWHDHQGDEHGIEFADGTKHKWPVGRMTDFLGGGGPKTLTLTELAIAYLEAKRE